MSRRRIETALELLLSHDWSALTHVLAEMPGPDRVSVDLVARTERWLDYAFLASIGDRGALLILKNELERVLQEQDP